MTIQMGASGATVSEHAAALHADLAPAQRASARKRPQSRHLRGVRLALAALVALVAWAGHAGTSAAAAAGELAVGTCAPTTIPAGSDGEAVIQFDGPLGGEAAGAELELAWSGADNQDMVAALAAPGERYVALLAAAPGSALNATFDDGAGVPAAEGIPADGVLTGALEPLEPLTGVAGASSESGWTVIILNTSDADLTVTACTLHVELAADPAPVRADAVDDAGGTSSLPQTGANVVVLALVGTVLVMAGVALRTRRRDVALFLAVALLASGVAAVAPAGPADADVPAAVAVSPGFVQTPIRPGNAWGYEIEQTVTARGLPPSSTVYLEQCESNPPPGNFSHEPSLEFQAPIRCQRVGARTITLDGYVNIAPTPFVVDAAGRLEANIVIRPTWDRDGQFIADINANGSCENYTVIIDCILRVVTAGGEVLASTTFGGGCTGFPPVAQITVEPQSGDAPLTVTADGSTSYVEGTCPAPISSYTFDFGDGTVIGPQTSAVASHTYTQTGVYTLRLFVTAGGTSRSTTTLIDVGSADEDGDGVPNAADNCPATANPGQADVDGDGMGDACDPTDDRPDPDDPDDPDNPEDPDEPTTGGCRAFQVDVVGSTGGLDWFQFDASGAACRDADGVRSLRSVSGTGEIVLPAVTRAILSALFTVQYDPDARRSGITFDGPYTADISGSFDLCALPMPPGLGKLVGSKLTKLFDIVSRWGGDRLIGRAADLWQRGLMTLVRATASRLAGDGGDAFVRAFDSVTDSLTAAFESALGAGAGLLTTGICVPFWEPTATVVGDTAGGVTYVVDSGGVLTLEVRFTSNAMPL